jgi:hypothetical protein
LHTASVGWLWVLFCFLLLFFIVLKFFEKIIALLKITLNKLIFIRKVLISLFRAHFKMIWVLCFCLYIFVRFPISFFYIEIIIRLILNLIIFVLILIRIHLPALFPLLFYIFRINKLRRTLLNINFFIINLFITRSQIKF